MIDHIEMGAPHIAHVLIAQINKLTKNRAEVFIQKILLLLLF